MPLKIRRIRGFSRVMILLIYIIVLVSSVLAVSNFLCSILSLLNARITRRPVRFSRVRRVILSMSFWKILNFGITTLRIETTQTMTMPIARAIIQVMSAAVRKAWIIATTAIIGARTSICSIMDVACWTWEMSLVVRVMREAVLNLSISEMLKLRTFLKNSLRISRENPMLILEERREAKKAQMAAVSAESAMWSPI